MRHWYPTPKPYSESRDAEQARVYRRVIRKIKRKTLPDAQRDVLMALFNLHWKHKNKTGVITHSRERIAKLAKCSTRTAARALERFRKEGVLTVKRYGKGGRVPTVYAFSVDAFLSVYDPTNAPIVVPGELVKMGVSQDKPARENRATVAHTYIDSPCSDSEMGSEADGEDWWKSLLHSLEDSLQQFHPVNKDFEGFFYLEGVFS